MMIEVDVELDQFSLDDLMDEVTYRLNQGVNTNFQPVASSLNRLKEAIGGGFINKNDSVQDLLKLDVMKKILDKYTLKEIENALPI